MSVRERRRKTVPLCRVRRLGGRLVRAITPPHQGLLSRSLLTNGSRPMENSASPRSQGFRYRTFPPCPDHRQRRSLHRFSILNTVRFVVLEPGSCRNGLLQISAPPRWAYIHSSESPRLTLSLEFGTPPLGPGSKPDPRHLSPAAVSERRTSLTSERVPR